MDAVTFSRGFFSQDKQSLIDFAVMRDGKRVSYINGKTIDEIREDYHDNSIVEMAIDEFNAQREPRRRRRLTKSASKRCAIFSRLTSAPAIASR
jgi:hypothetical protein